MTYVTAIDFAINAITDNDEVVEKLKALKEQIQKKNSAERKPTKTQQENEVLKNEIVKFLTERRTATEVADRFGVSVNKATAMLTLLKQEGRVTREVEKRKAYYIAVDAE
jgi:predicted Rossmann fold nucleotide-binding protein DprA/Smf involved in DNA uptake